MGSATQFYTPSADRATVSWLIPRRSSTRQQDGDPVDHGDAGGQHGVHRIRPALRGQQRITPRPQEQVTATTRRHGGSDQRPRIRREPDGTANVKAPEDI